MDCPSVVLFSSAGDHQDRRDDHRRDENEHDGDQQNFIQYLIEHDDPFLEREWVGPSLGLDCGRRIGVCDSNCRQRPWLIRGGGGWPSTW